MALSDEQIEKLTGASRTRASMWLVASAIARAIEAEIRKDDEALIRQLRDALEMCSGVPHWPSLQPTIAAANARLLDSDLSTLTERGAKAWAGVDPQKLREGGAL